MSSIENLLKSNTTDKTEGGLLSILWRKILVDLNMTNRIPAMIYRYVNDVNTSSLQVKKKSKSSITNDIISENMTWKVFINLLISILKVKKIRFTVTLEFNNGTKSNHSIDVNP